MKSDGLIEVVLLARISLPVQAQPCQPSVFHEVHQPGGFAPPLVPPAALPPLGLLPPWALPPLLLPPELLPPELLPPELLPPELLPPELLPPELLPPLALPPELLPPELLPPELLPPELLPPELLPPELLPPELLPPLALPPLALPPLLLPPDADPPLLLPPELLPPDPLLPPEPPWGVTVAGAQAISANARLPASRARGSRPWDVWFLADRPELGRAARELVENIDNLQGANVGRALIPYVRAQGLLKLSIWCMVLQAISRTGPREMGQVIGWNTQATPDAKAGVQVTVPKGRQLTQSYRSRPIPKESDLCLSVERVWAIAPDV